LGGGEEVNASIVELTQLLNINEINRIQNKYIYIMAIEKCIKITHIDRLQTNIYKYFFIG